MTARPTGPQVTSSACVQRDTEGLCQGECPARHGLLAGSVRVRAGAGGGGGPGPHLRVHVLRAECNGPAYVMGHLCLSRCPPRYFNRTRQAVTGGPGRLATPALHVCASCHSSCYACRGSSPRDCTACPPAYTLDAGRGSCSPPAPRAGPPQPTATARPCRQRLGPAQALVLALLAVAFGSPLLCSVLSMGCPPPCASPPSTRGHPSRHPRTNCWPDPEDIQLGEPTCALA